MTRNKIAIGSDLVKIDAHAITDEEYGEIPELADDFFVHAKPTGEVIAEIVQRSGRPKSLTPKKLVSLRLDPDVIDAFRSTGNGWQSRINAVLREHLPKAGS